MFHNTWGPFRVGTGDTTATKKVHLKRPISPRFKVNNYLQQSAIVYVRRRFSKWPSSVSTQARSRRVREFRSLSKIPGACMEYNTSDEMVQYFPIPSAKVIQICGSSWHESGYNIGTGSNRTHVYMNLFHCFWCPLSKLERSGCRTLRNTLHTI